MASASAHFNRAVALHREAAAHVEAARAELARQQATPALSTGQLAGYQRMAQVLDAAAAQITPGWLGCALDGRARARKLGVDARLGEAMHVFAGTGLLGQSGEAVQPASHPPAGAVGAGCEFAVAVPFLGVGHVAVDRDARDPQVAGWMRGLLLRAVAALPDGALRVLPVDGATLGSLFTPFRGLVDAQVWATPATTLDGLRGVLDVAEDRVAAVQAGIPGDLPYLLIAAGGLPVGAGSTEHARLAALAHAGPAARVHLLVAGYPPTGPARFGRPPGWTTPPISPPTVTCSRWASLRATGRWTSGAAAWPAPSGSPTHRSTAWSRRCATRSPRPPARTARSISPA